MPCAGVIGAGTMGHGIAQCFALAGWRVNLFDPDDEALESVAERVRRNLETPLDLGLVTPRQAEACPGNIVPCRSLEDLAEGAEIIIESATEDLELKRRIFAELESKAAAETILATNTSALAIGLIAQNLDRPERVVGTHFWNPPHVLPCVEVVRSVHTGERVFEATYGIMEAIGKKPIRVKKDVPGFLGNRMQHALQREAMSLVDRGVAEPEDIDRVVRYGFGLRLALMGPLERADLGGLDVTLSVQSYLLEYLENGTVPSAALREKVRAGDLGAKTGRGFYEWSGEKIGKTTKRRDRLLLELIRMVEEE